MNIDKIPRRETLPKRNRIVYIACDLDDEMKARRDINWSQVASKAFAEVLKKLKSVK